MSDNKSKKVKPIIVADLNGKTGREAGTSWVESSTMADFLKDPKKFDLIVGAAGHKVKGVSANNRLRKDQGKIVTCET